MADRQVVVHNSASVDGRLALSPETLLMFDERWPTTAGDGYAAVMQRWKPQVILEGSGSFVVAEKGPEAFPEYRGGEDAFDPHQPFLPEPAVAAARAGWLVVPDSRGRVRWRFKQFPGSTWRGWHLLVLVTTSTPVEYLRFLRAEGIPYLVAGTGPVDLGGALGQLHDRFGAERVVATGGGRLGGALLRAGLVDLIEVETVPIAVGGTSTASMFTAPDLAGDAAPVRLELEDLDRTALGGVRAVWRVVERG